MSSVSAVQKWVFEPVKISHKQAGCLDNILCWTHGESWNQFPEIRVVGH